MCVHDRGLSTRYNPSDPLLAAYKAEIVKKHEIKCWKGISSSFQKEDRLG